MLALAVPGANYYGLLLMDGAKLNAEGSPVNLCRIVRYNTAQEQANNTYAGLRGPGLIFPWWTATPTPEVRLRFADLASLQDEVIRDYHRPGNTLSIRDSQVRGGWITKLPDGALGVTNSLWQRVALRHAQFSGGAVFRNNLFFGGALTVVLAPNTSFQDNFFDRTAITNNATVANSHNGYITGYNRLEPPASTDKIVSGLSWQSGPLNQQYYQPPTSPLIDAGSQSAAASGLYHFTTTTSQAKEASTQVDIGLHYLALNGQNQAIDTDADYVSDWQEDANGNGVQDAGEFSHTVADTNHDTDLLTSYQEWQLGYNATKADSDGDGIPDHDEDYDGDFLSDYAEFVAYGSDPKVPNSMHQNFSDFYWFYSAAAGQSGSPATLSFPSFPEGNVQLTLTSGDGAYDLYFAPDSYPNPNDPYRWSLYALGPATRPNPPNAPIVFTQVVPGTDVLGWFMAGRTRQAGGTIFDFDDDTLDDAFEGFVLRSSPNTAHTDGLPPVGDGVPDNLDSFPRDPAAWLDTDGDGMPDHLRPGIATTLIEDDDDDNDGIPDIVEDPDQVDGPPYVSNPKDPNSRPPPRWFVNLNAPPGGDGSKDLPFQTIQAAIDAANADYQIVQVEAGTYNESLRFNGKKVQVRSLRGTEETIINGAAGDWAVRFDGPETESTGLEGFTIRNGGWGGVALFNGCRPVIVNCVIQNNGAQTPVGVGGIHCSSSSPTIINCKILNNGNTMRPGGGLYASGNSAPRVSHCTFSGNLRPATSLGGQIHATNTANITSINCVVWSTVTSAEIVAAASGKVIASFSNVRDGYPGLLNINADPFLDSSGRLVRTSAGKDQGSTNGVPGYGWLTRYDQDGEARLQDSPVNILFNADIGSDEFVYRIPFQTDTDTRRFLNGNGEVADQVITISEVDEASGAAFLGNDPNMNGGAVIAFIDDEENNRLFVYTLTATGDGVQQRQRVTLGSMGADIEGLTYDSANRVLYAICSHNRRNEYRNLDTTLLSPVTHPPVNDYQRNRCSILTITVPGNFQFDSPVANIRHRPVVNDAFPGSITQVPLVRTLIIIDWCIETPWDWTPHTLFQPRRRTSPVPPSGDSTRREYQATTRWNS